jgi:hypothetical protein
MDRLPAELILKIAQFLVDSHLPSLRNFSSVNSTIRQPITSILFREVSIRCMNSNDLVSDIAELCDILIKYDCALSVKALIMVDFDRQFTKPSLYHWRGSDPYCGSTARGEYKYKRPRRCDLAAPLLPPLAEKRRWRSLPEFLERIPKLQDLIFDVHTQFPTDALEVLHRTNPRCRLHMPQFRLRSLGQSALSPRELALISSPCVYSIILRLRAGVPERYDFNWDAVFNMINGAAPNLRHVRIIDHEYRDHLWDETGEYWFSPWMPNLPSQRRIFCPTSNNQKKPANILSFGYDGPPTHLLPIFLTDLNPERLQALEIWSRAPDSARELLQLSTDFQFPFLKRLSWDGVLHQGSMEQFISGLVNLQHLHISSHVQSLERIPPVFKASCAILCDLDLSENHLDATSVQRLASFIPSLQSIRFNMERALSLPPETDVYTALKDFPALRSVALIMTYRRKPHREPYIPPMELWDRARGLDQRLTSRGIQGARDLCNMAVDADLVRQIWLEIMGHRTMSESPLTVRVLHDYDHGRTGRDHPHRLVCPEWLARSNPGDANGMPEVIDVNHRRSIPQDPPEEIWGLMYIFRILWPPKEGSKDPWYDMSSLPLRFRRDLDVSQLPCWCSIRGRPCQDQCWKNWSST